MKIRIGAFGSKETIEKLKVYEEKNSFIQIIPFTYQDPSESRKLVKKAYGCDVFFFTGPVPYLYAKDIVETMEIPTTFVPFDQLMISNAFNLVNILYHEPIARLSIDIAYEEHVKEILDVLNITSNDIYIYDFADRTSFEINEIVNFHLSLWKNGSIDMVLTSVVAVEERLKQYNVKCLKMPIPKKNVHQALKEAETLGKLQLSQTSEIVVGFVKIKKLEQLQEQVGDFKFEKIFLSIHQILLQCTHEMGLSLYRGGNQFVIFGTRGSLEKLIAEHVLLEYLREIETTLKISIAIGFGSGVTAIQAEERAKQAMLRASEDSASSSYLLNESGQYIYLLHEEAEGTQRQLLINEIINKSSITEGTAAIFVDFLMISHFRPFSVQQYASYSNVTVRTAARFIKKLVESEVLEVAGEKKLFDKGRPRIMYQFKGE